MILRKDTISVFFIYSFVLFIGLTILNQWHFGRTLGSHDFISGHVMTMKRFILNGGVENSIYDFYISGGSEVLPVQGILPIQEVLLKLKFSAFNIINITVFFILLINGILLRSLFRESYLYIYKKKFEANLFLETLLAIVFMFLPSIGWRVNYGHLNIINGVIAYAICIIVPLKIYNQSFSISKMMIIGIFLSHVLPYSSFQMVIYAIFFSMPIYFFIFYKIFKEKKTFHLHYGLGSILIGIIISSPILYLILDYFLSGNSSRKIENDLLFSYIGPSLDVLYSSLTISRQAIPNKYNLALHHEINYPLTLTAITIFFFAIYKSIQMRIKIAPLVFLSCLMMIVFSFNFFGLTEILVKSIPIMGSFRVPYRTFIFMNINILITSLILITSKISSIKFIELGIAILVILFTSIIPSAYLEILCLLILLFTYFLFRRKTNPRSAFVYICLLAALNTKGFSERFTETHDISSIEDNLTELSKADDIKGEELFKTINYVRNGVAHSNSLLLNNSSVINAFWHPNKNFNDAFSLIFNLPIDPSRLYFPIDIHNKYFSTFESMYAIRTTLFQPQAESSKVHLVKNNNVKNIWSPTEVHKFSDSNTFYNFIRDKGKKTIDLFSNYLFISQNIKINKNSFTKCKYFEIDKVENGTLSIKIENNSPCLIVLPINYSHNLTAFNSTNTPVQLFNANGPLVGMLIPENSKKIVLKASSSAPQILETLKYFISILALSYFILEILFFFKNKKR
jgi:hypothetical protein